MGLAAIAVGTAGALDPTAQAQSFRDNMINQRCTKAATADFAKLAKTPPRRLYPLHLQFRGPGNQRPGTSRPGQGNLQSPGHCQIRQTLMAGAVEGEQNPCRLH